MYISHRKSEGGLVFSPHQRRSPNTRNSPPSNLLDSFSYPHKMDYLDDAKSDTASSALEDHYVRRYVEQMLDGELAAGRVFAINGSSDIPWCTLPDERNILLESTVDLTTRSPARADCGERCNSIFLDCCLTLELQNRWLQPSRMST